MLLVVLVLAGKILVAVEQAVIEILIVVKHRVEEVLQSLLYLVLLEQYIL